MAACETIVAEKKEPAEPRLKARPLRVLLSPSAFYPNVGGVEEIARNLARQIGGEHEVAIAVNRYPENCLEVEELDQTVVHRFPFIYPARNAEFFTQSVRALSGFKRFASFIDSWKPDLVHVICPSSNSLYIAAARALYPFKLLVNLQGEFFMDAHGIYQQSQLARFGAQQLLNRADAITACSQYVLDDAKKRFRINSKIETVIFNGVDLHEAQSDEATAMPLPDRYILAAGRLVANKGFDYLIEAMARIADRSITLIIAGDGPDRNRLESKVSQLGLNNVHFAGRVGRSEITRLFSNCLFFVMPSPVEPFGIVCLEALRAGKPVIATNAGGPPEFIQDGTHGLLVQPRDAQSLGEAIQRLLQDDELRNKATYTCRTYADSFDWSKISTQYTDIYQQLTADR